MTGKEIRFAIKADSSQLLGEYAKVKAENARLKRSTKGVATASSRSFAQMAMKIGAVYMALRVVTRMVGSWVKLAMKQQRVEAQLNATLESTGHAAGMTSEELRNMASALQEVTHVGDEVTITGQSLLLTFTNIGRDVFPQATETLLDMTTALNDGQVNASTLKQQAIMLGKALNDPIKGISALRRVGVQLSAAQENQIRQFMRLNRVGDAQKVILQELKKQFGGSARAYAQTMAGQLQQLENAAGDAGEALGRELFPVIRNFVVYMKSAVKGGTLFGDTLGYILKWIGKAGTGIIKMVTVIDIFYNRIMARRAQWLAQIAAQQELQLLQQIQERTGVATLREARERATDAEQERLVELRRFSLRYNSESTEHNNRMLAAANALEEINRNINEDLKEGNKLRTAAGNIRVPPPPPGPGPRGRSGLTDLAQVYQYTGRMRDAEMERENKHYNRLWEMEDLSKVQRQAIHTQHMQNLSDLKLKYSGLKYHILVGMAASIQAFLGSIDAANRQLLHSMLWGKGGWNEFKKSTKEIMKRLVSDILYAIARAAILQAVLAGTGLAGGGGGLVAKTVLGSFEKGRMPVLAKGQMPVLAGGSIPANHFPAWIGSDEAVMDAASTRANYDLLNFMHNNKGVQVGAPESVTTHTNINLDGRTIAEVVDVHRNENARNSGAQNYGKRSVYK